MESRKQDQDSLLLDGKSLERQDLRMTGSSLAEHSLIMDLFGTHNIKLDSLDRLAIT